MFSDQMVEPEHTLVWTVFCLPPQHVALSVDVSEKKPELQVIQEFGKPNFFNAPPPSCTLRYSTMTLGPEVSAPCEADRLSGLSRSCMIRRSWVCSLLMCWTFFCYAVAVFFVFFYTILIVNVCLRHIFLSLYDDYAIIHTMYIFFFFLCDAAIYLLKYYSDVWTIVLFVLQPHGESTTKIVSETFIH